MNTASSQPKKRNGESKTVRRTQKPVIVLYSGYRTSSTWLWSRFRKNDRLCCYYEVFNESLAKLHPSLIGDVKPGMWRSRHPDGAPYMIEYAPLLNEEPGLPGFPVDDTLAEKLVGQAGLDGPLDADVDAYLATLVQSAEAQDKLAVITCTRMLGRIAGIKKSFPGLHILLTRNLFRQWNSYSGQHRTGNIYFFDMLFRTMSLSNKIPFIDYISSFFAEDRKSSVSAWIAKENYDKLFCYFVAFHIYFYIHARRHADLTIDINSLSDLSRRTEIERAIHELSGVEVDLAGADDQIDYPAHVIESVEQCRWTLHAMILRAFSELNVSEDERSYALKLVEDLWAEHRRFSFYTQSADEAWTETLRRTEILQAEAAERLAEVERDSQARVADLLSQLNTSNETATASRNILSDAEARLAEAIHHNAEREQKSDDYIAQLISMHAESEQQHAAKLSDLSKTIEAMTSHIAEIEQDRTSITSQYAQYREGRTSREKSLKRRMSKLLEKGKSLRRNIKNLDEKIIEIETNHALHIQEASKIIHDLNSSSRDLSGKVSNLSQENHILQVERHRLYEDLELDGGPMALRKVLPLARILRPLLRSYGKLKRAVGKKPDRS